MSEYKSGKYLKSARLILMITLSIFSVVLIVLNRLLGWEIWMEPIIGIGAIFCWYLQFSGGVSERLHIYLCGVFLMFLTFYYSVNIKTIYDSTAIIAIVILIFSFTGKRALALGGLITGMGGMTLHLLITENRNFHNPDHSNLIRTGFQYVLVWLTYLLGREIMRIWDITERDFTRRLKLLEDENSRVNNFLANVSHEIRTPINAVIGLSNVIEQEPLPDHVRENVDAISEAGHRVAEQIGDILDFTEIDMNRLAVSHESYNINSLVNDLIAQLSFAETYGLELVIDMDADLPMKLAGDGTKIKRILWQLISNGFKFTREGGVYVHLYPLKRTYGINLVMEVKDSGVGMDEDEIEHVYDKFYQSDGGRSRTSGGLGLGIPIANGFAKSMGGLISIESVPYEGTTVRVSIPQDVIDSSPCLSVGDRRTCVAAGFLNFVSVSHMKVREYYMDMISHMVSGLNIPFHRVQTLEELTRLLPDVSITHLFVGTHEYMEHRDYIDNLSQTINVALVANTDFHDPTPSSIVLLPKPFYGVQIVNFLNHKVDGEDYVDETRITCPGVRVLVVDDEPMNLLVARGIFESYGMIVTTAGGGREAIDLCRHEDYDIIFMDHMMPDMDGVEVMKRLRTNASKDRKDLCIVALTANAISSAKEMFMSEGFDGFIPKPIEISDLERVLKHVLPRSAIVYSDKPALSPARNPEQTHLDEESEEMSDIMPDVISYDVPVEEPGTEFEEWPEYDSFEIYEAPDNYMTTDSDTAAGNEGGLSALQALGVDTQHGVDYCQGDEDFYREILLEYAKDRGEKTGEFESALEREDLDTYAIRVHAVKSTSKLIGAMELSELARQLEMAAKDGDISFVQENHLPFLAGYDSLMAEINTALGRSEAGPEGDDLIIEFDPEEV